MKTLFSKIGLLPIFFTMQLCIAIFCQSLLYEGFGNVITVIWMSLVAFFGGVLGKRILTYKNSQYEA